MTNKIYTWETVPDEKIELETTFRYNNEDHTDLFGWSPGFNDLQLTLKITPADVDIHKYLKPNETAYWVIVWTTDKKFTGTSKLIEYKNVSQNILCNIPNFFTDTSLALKLLLIAQCKNIFEIPRLNGSILFEKEIDKTEKTGKGEFFPIKEVMGDGLNLVLFDFRKPDDFNTPVADVFEVKIDLNHRLAKDFHSNKDIRSFIFLLIIQNYYGIALSDDVFEEIQTGAKFEIGSIGYSFNQILNAMVTEYKFNEKKSLKDYFDKYPYKVNEKIVQFFSNKI